MHRFSQRVASRARAAYWGHFGALHTRPERRPSLITLGLSNTCNYHCPICSIHNMRKSGISHQRNQIELTDLRKLAPMFAHTRSLCFLGFYGESILNPEFEGIIRYLKSDHSMGLEISTNGVGLTEPIQEAMLETGFDHILFSLHAATSETYKILQGDFFDQATANLGRLQRRKRELGKDRPQVTIVYALNRANLEETPQILEFAAANGIHSVYLYHYNDYGRPEFSLENEPDLTNAKIEEIYSYAEKRRFLYLLPQRRPYLPENRVGAARRCFLPWEGLQMRGSFSHLDSFYLGCCSAFNPFLFNYREHLEAYGKFDFDRIWHHPVLQYLRQTVNHTWRYNVNPMCEYCRSPERRRLKHRDNKTNYIRKLQVIDQFWSGFELAWQGAPKVAGLRLLRTEDNELRALAGPEFLLANNTCP